MGCTVYVSIPAIVVADVLDADDKLRPFTSIRTGSPQSITAILPVCEQDTGVPVAEAVPRWEAEGKLRAYMMVKMGKRHVFLFLPIYASKTILIILPKISVLARCCPHELLENLTEIAGVLVAHEHPHFVGFDLHIP